MKYNKGNAVLVLVVLFAFFFGYTALKKSGSISPSKEDSSVSENTNSDSRGNEVSDVKDDSGDKEEGDRGEKDGSGEAENAQDKEQDQEKEIVCCKIAPVVPHPTYQYQFTTRDECKIPCKKAVDSAGHEFEACATGGSYEIVYDSFCEKGEIKVEDTEKTKRKPPVHVSSVLPLPEYVYAQGDWPPIVEHLHRKYECNEGDTGGDVSVITKERVIHGKRFCIASTVEGAAGSRYEDYTYTTQTSDGIERVTFTLRYPSCGAYGSPERERCEYSQSHFNLDDVVASFNW